jgi:hypothetical protein
VTGLDVMCTSRPERPLALVSISTGFEADFIAAREDGRHRQGLVGSTLRALATAFDGRRRGARLLLDGLPVLGPEDAYYNAGLYALPCYAFGWQVVPEAVCMDGRAEMVLHDDAGTYWGSLASAMVGRPAGSGRRQTWRTARLRSSGPMQVDGETLAAGEIEVWIEPRALRVVTAGP